MNEDQTPDQRPSLLDRISERIRRMIRREMHTETPPDETAGPCQRKILEGPDSTDDIYATYQMTLRSNGQAIGTFRGRPIYDEIFVDDTRYVYVGVGHPSDIIDETWGRDRSGKWQWPHRVIIDGLLYIRKETA